MGPGQPTSGQAQSDWVWPGRVGSSKARLRPPGPGWVRPGYSWSPVAGLLLAADYLPIARRWRLAVSWPPSAGRLLLAACYPSQPPRSLPPADERRHAIGRHRGGRIGEGRHPDPFGVVERRARQEASQRATPRGRGLQEASRPPEAAPGEGGTKPRHSRGPRRRSACAAAYGAAGLLRRGL